MNRRTTPTGGEAAGQQRNDPMRFDAGFYLATYPEVAKSGLDPYTHYIRRGWKEGKDPSPYFSTQYYLEAHPDIRAAGINPFEHYVHHGHREGRSIGLTRARREAFLAEVARLLAAEAEAGAEVKSAAEATDSELVAGSRFFDADRVAAALGPAADRRELVARWLDLAPADRPAPGPHFDPAFYRAAYLGGGAGGGPDPFLHFLRQGLAAGHYPNALRLAQDAALVRASRVFDLRYWTATRRGAPRHRDPVEDCLLGGLAPAGVPRPGFDADFVARVHMAPRGATGSPFAYWLRHRERPWIFAGPDELATVRDAVATSPLFDADFYAEVAGIDPARVDPALHYVLRGVPAGLPVSVAFHTGHYLARYPDLRRARLNPLLHFERHGRAENRAGVPEHPVPPPPALLVPGGAGRREERPRAIVVTHEASFTGAPIVALNIVRHLGATHDVIVWLGRDGPLVADFEGAGAEVIRGFVPPLDAADILARALADGPIDFAIVNSALSGLAIEPLRQAGIPVLLLIHDFATYVYPRGTLSRYVLNADLAVFPARVVAEAFREELSLLGADCEPDHVRILHQGYNGAQKSALATLTPEAILERIGAAGRREAVRIVLGGGWVQPRKGVDLFLETAARLLREGGADWRFIWVGGNYRPNEDMMVSAYLADHVARGGLAGRMFFFDEQPDLESFWEVADVFFLSSRLDPFPNIALDALMRDVPVVCFEGATGIADLAGPFGFAVKTAPFADAAEAAREIAGLAAALPEVRARFRALRPEMDRAFSFDTYVAELVRLAGEAAARSGAARALAGSLVRRPRAELDRIAAAMPDWALLAPVAEPRARAATLAALATCRGPAAGLEAAEGAPARLPVATGAAVRRLLPPPAPGAAEGRWCIHLHAPDEAALRGLLARVRLPAGVPVRISSPAGGDFAELLPEGAVALRMPCTGPLAGLAACLAAGSEDFVLHAEAGIAPPEVLDRLLDPVLADAAIGHALADGAIAAIWCEAGFLPRPRTALARRAALADAVPPAVHAPAFTAILARAPLEAFLAAERAALARASAGLSPLEAATLAALAAAEDAARRGLGLLVLPDPEDCPAETADLGVRRGIPAGLTLLPPAPPPEPEPTPAPPESGTRPGGSSAFARLWRGIARSTRRSGR